AIPDLPEQLELGKEAARLSQGAAKAILGKVYLQQEKFAEAAAVFAEVNGDPGGTSKYGYRLLDNFGDLFKTSNEYNSESIMDISYTFTSAGAWGDMEGAEGNFLNIMIGPRSYAPGSGAPDYVSGWGFLPVTDGLAAAMQGDPRYEYTIIDM